MQWAGFLQKNTFNNNTSSDSNIKNDLFLSMESALQKYDREKYKEVQQSVTNELVSIQQNNGKIVGIIT